MNVSVVDRPAKAKPSSIHSEVVEITPDIARAWLDKNEQNRRVSRSRVVLYARDMANRSWGLTGDAIRFDTRSRLIDGQHRLLACIQADTSFTTVVIYGLEPQSKDLIDTGLTRSIANMLQVQGIPNATIVGGMLRLVIAARKEPIYVSGKVRPTHAEIAATHEKHPAIGQCAVTGKIPKSISAIQISFLNYVASKYLARGKEAQCMISVIKTGVPAYDEDPIHQFREKIINISSLEMLHGSYRNHVWWTLVHCWNLFSQGQRAARVQWRKEPVSILDLDPKKL